MKEANAEHAECMLGLGRAICIGRIIRGTILVLLVGTAISTFCWRRAHKFDYLLGLFPDEIERFLGPPRKIIATDIGPMLYKDRTVFSVKYRTIWVGKSYEYKSYIVVVDADERACVIYRIGGVDPIAVSDK